MQSRTQAMLPFLDDFHVHLREGDFAEHLAAEVISGGANRVLVMPNLKEPITTGKRCAEYHEMLSKRAPNIEFLMTLYLSPSITEEDLRETCIVACKLYPQGVTTGSDSGVTRIQDVFPVLRLMESLGLLLLIHGEQPGASSFEAESEFLPTIDLIHNTFPSLRIVLEHVTTKEAVEFVQSRDDWLAATITVHHLYLTIDDILGNTFNYCKPVPKFFSDRQALRDIVLSGHPRFFLGSDSAPHDKNSKVPNCCTHKSAAAGIYTSKYLLHYLLDFFQGETEKIRKFACQYGAEFYRIPVKTANRLRIIKKPLTIPSVLRMGEFHEVVPFKAGEVLDYDFVCL
jgi:dihydroorotase